MLAGPFPHIPCRVNKLIAHLHFSILQPQGDMLKVNCYGSFKDRSSSAKLSYTGFPFGILEPGAHMMLLHAQGVLEVLTHAVLVVIQLIRVCDPHLGRLMFVELVLY